MSARAATGELRASLALLATRRFGTYWFATLLSNIGTWAQQVAEPWLLLAIGASPFVIGLDSFAMNAPIWLLTFAGGFLADRADRRRVIAVFQSIQMLCPTILVVLLVRGTISPFVVVALSLVVGVTDALSMPSFQSIVPSIVDRERIARGLALNATQFNLSRILGPAIAGVLLASAGVVACFALSAASYVPFVAVAMWILPRGRRAGADDSAAPADALRRIFRARAARRALSTVLVTSVLCAPLVTFCPVLVKELGGSSSAFSASVAAFGAGGLVGATALLAVPPERDRGVLASRLALAYAGMVVLAAIAPSAWAVPALMLAAGAAMTTSNTSANALLQATAEPALLGRTVSLFMLAMRGGLALGAVGTGALVELVGVRHALLVDGALAAVLHLVLGASRRER